MMNIWIGSGDFWQFSNTMEANSGWKRMIMILTKMMLMMLCQRTLNLRTGLSLLFLTMLLPNKLGWEFTSCWFNLIKIRTNNSTKNKFIQPWLSSSKKARFNCNMSPEMYLDMIEMEINQLLTMNSLTFV